jgi:hypothetical protein
MFINHHNNSPVARQQRQVDRFIARAADAEARQKAAQAKRERKNNKRRDDAISQAMGQYRAREALNAGAPRGMSVAGLHHQLVDVTMSAAGDEFVIGDHHYTGVRYVGSEVVSAQSDGVDGVLA